LPLQVISGIDVQDNATMQKLVKDLGEGNLRHGPSIPGRWFSWCCDGSNHWALWFLWMMIIMITIIVLLL
jgi:hypothetical protein